MTTSLSRSERQDLLQLIRSRERVAKNAAAERAAQLRADFETQMDTHYSFNTNEVWAAAVKAADAVAREMQEKVAAECERLGIPRQFAPAIAPPGWYSRGENMLKERRVELRRLARVHIEANQKSACTVIAQQSVEAQTAVIASGLSEAGLAFLATLPSADAMMPRLAVAQVEKMLPASQRS